MIGKFDNMVYVIQPGFTPDHLGYLPGFLSTEDERPAKQQFDANYQHGGGWRPLPDWKLDPETKQLTYPGDPPLMPFAVTTLRGEIILFYPDAQVLVLQKDGSFEVSRMD
jgi:hypothetical protein